MDTVHINCSMFRPFTMIFGYTDIRVQYPRYQAQGILKKKKKKKKKINKRLFFIHPVIFLSLSIYLINIYKRYIR